MVSIAPFKALRYDTDWVDPDSVTSPPHDVVTEEEEQAYREQDERNIMHIIQPAGKDAFDNAARLIQEWEEEGTLTRDERPAYYMYEIHHDQGIMRGFFARVRLDPTYQEIRRHEKTLAGKKRTRLDLRTATRCDTESIWMLYRDERGWVDEILRSNAFEELLKTTDEQGNVHVLWRIDRPEAVGEITAQFEDRTIVIADGHHRYQTALDHHAETGRDEDNSILVCLVRDNDPGLRIEPTHRVVVEMGIEPDTALGVAASDWEIEPWTGDLDPVAMREWVDADPRRCIVLVGEAAECLTLKKGREVDEGRGRLDTLVVTRVHERLLARWGIGPDDAERCLRFTRSETEAVERAMDEGVLCVVMLSGEEVDAVLDVASQGHVMPQKATYFVPKLRSGIVLGPLDEPSPRPWQEVAGDGGKAEFKMPRDPSS